jgi:hypothetical protein
MLSRHLTAVMATSLHHYKMSPGEIDHHRCRDCGVNVILVGDYCPLKSELWHQMGLGSRDDLCVACAEQRLGRRLTPSDFASTATVEGFPPSVTLINRLGLDRPES